MEQKNSHYKKEHIYSLEEKPEREISPLWQIVQVIFYLCSVACGFVVSYCFSNATVTLNQNCILYAKVSLQPLSVINTTHDIKSIDPIFDYQNESYCNIVIFIPVIITSFGSFFMVMFVICGRGGAGNKNLPDTWRIIMPSIIFNLIGFGLALLSANTFESGMGEFLKNLSKVSKQDIIEVKDLSNIYLGGKHVGTRLVYFSVMTKYAIRMLVSFWGLNFFWIFLRCIFVVDFQLVKTTIHIYTRETKIYQMAALKSSTEMNQFSNTSMEVTEEDGILQRDSAIRFRAVHFSPSTKDISQQPDPTLVDASTSTSELSQVESLTDAPNQESAKKAGKITILRNKKVASN